ncbi:hypothetical protein EI94DRAFT_1774604 [Lactarius quietus]|nr:hypothetical protein EI94DRAFT_1774604 [Lactarius quietus]
MPLRQSSNKGYNYLETSLFNKPPTTPLITRNLAKGVAPRLHEPKAKAKAHATKDIRQIKLKRSRKRTTSSDKESDIDGESHLSDSSAIKIKKNLSKRRCMEESDSEEEEIVDEDVKSPEKEIEEVDGGCSEQDRTGKQGDDGLNGHQHGVELEEKTVKKDLTLNLLTIMLDRVIVKFKMGQDVQFVKLHGKRKAFHKGGNSSCHVHTRQHYVVYKARCEKAEIAINHWAIPCDIWKVMEEEKVAEEQG